MELYSTVLSCSFAARVVAREAEIPLDLREVDLFEAKLAKDGAPYAGVVPVGLVPALRLDDGTTLTEMSAVLQWLADQRPESGLAPPWGTPERYRLVSWLSYVGTEIHKKTLWPLFNAGVPDAVKEFGRASAPRAFDHLERHLAGRAHLVGDRFTAADAYAFWALYLARFAGLDPAGGRPSLRAYVERHLERPSVRDLLAEEGPRAAAAYARRRR